jgi:hypothetical protein
VKPTSSLRSLWRRADQHRNALLLVFEPDLQLNAVRPNVDAASASEKSPVEIALQIEDRRRM